VRERVTIYHPEVGQSEVDPRTVATWERSGWSTTKPRPKRERRAPDPPADVPDVNPDDSSTTPE